MDLSEDELNSINILQNFLENMFYMRFGRTRDRKMGSLPLMTQKEDHICVVDGMELPYVVRPGGGPEGNHLLVSECCISTLMAGEAMDITGVESVIVT